jgi:hypothetical protein
MVMGLLFRGSICYFFERRNYLEAIVAVILYIVGFILDWLFGDEDAEGERTGGAIDAVWNGVKTVGSGVVDWFSDPEVEGSTKLAVGLAGAYMLAPDATSNAVEAAGESIGSFTSSIGGGIVDVAKQIPWYIWLGVGLLAFALLGD